MKNLLRVALTTTTALVAVAATMSAAQAYYREVLDPSGDVKAYSGCAGAHGRAKLDIVRVGATSEKRGDTGSSRSRRTSRS